MQRITGSKTWLRMKKNAFIFLYVTVTRWITWDMRPLQCLFKIKQRQRRWGWQLSALKIKQCAKKTCLTKDLQRWIWHTVGMIVLKCTFILHTHILKGKSKGLWYYTKTKRVAPSHWSSDCCENICSKQCSATSWFWESQLTTDLQWFLCVFVASLDGIRGWKTLSVLAPAPLLIQNWHLLGKYSTPDSLLPRIPSK